VLFESVKQRLLALVLGGYSVGDGARGRGSVNGAQERAVGGPLAIRGFWQLSSALRLGGYKSYGGDFGKYPLKPESRPSSRGARAQWERRHRLSFLQRLFEWTSASLRPRTAPESSLAAMFLHKKWQLSIEGKGVGRHQI
jgi:hypothetical protein